MLVVLRNIEKVFNLNFKSWFTRDVDELAQKYEIRTVESKSRNPLTAE